MRKYIAIIIASLALFTGQAHAQRCLPKMQGIEVRADMADGFNLGGKDGGYSFGAALSTYTKKGNKWVFGGEYLLKNNPYKECDTRGAVHGGGRLLLQDTVGRPKDCFRLCRGFGSRRI